jgi:uncharacterized OB-fold protein
MPAQVAIDEALFTWPSDDPRLLGSRCTECGCVMFPQQSGCARCMSTEIERAELPTRGTLWTWTTQGFRPKSAPEGSYRGNDTVETFETFALGYVALPGACKIETRLVGDDFEIDGEMELVIVPFCKDDEGNDVMTFAFRKVQS